jgi:hypothetical protein
MYNQDTDAALFLERAAEYMHLAESATRANIKADYRRMAELCREIAESLLKIAETPRRDNERKSKR